MRTTSTAFCLRVALSVALAALLAGCSTTTPTDDVPPVVYMCPMLKDAEVVEEHAGKCPKCGMELKPVRIVKAYSCLNNTAFIQANPGKCPTNGTDLVPISASMFWVCPQSPDKHELSPGKCADGADRIQKFEPRLHGDHNPRHGGQLFMADDGWHHVEGAYPKSGLFRAFFYDDWTRPLAPDGFTARVIVKDSTGKETATISLERSELPNVMDARIPNATLPFSASLRVRFNPNEPEKLFDFTFNAYSKEPGEPTAISGAPEPVIPKPSPPVTTPPPVPGPPPQVSSAPVSDRPALSPTDVIPTGPFQLEPIPANAREILAELDARSKELSDKIERRMPLGEYWVPALRTKDLALALVNEHLSEIPAARRASAENAVSRLLRAAYAIDNFGDLGDFEKIVSAHDEFELAVSDLRTACASIK